MDEIEIRRGIKEDIPQVLELVKELAAYERSSEQVTNTVPMMERDGFGKNPIYGMFVADRAKKIVGISVYYYRYSTWKGKRLYLEDIVVTKSERGQGIGKRLFEETLIKALEEKCTGVMWQVLDWNEPAIDFYKKYGAAFDSSWVNCSLEGAEIKGALKGSV
jgi:GNAT superfamily N-acetyltransferase